MKERIKSEKRSGKKGKRWMNQVKEKNNSARKDVMLLTDETFTLFQTMCNLTTRTHDHWCLVVIISFALAHVHHSKSSHP
jgi:hypothetical protein